MDNGSLGDRMKEYEAITKNKLIKRMPVMMRIDGRAFHTFTKNEVITGDSKPFSAIMHELMTYTTQLLCDNIQNVEFAYTQSDEISLYLRDWNTLTTQQWFNGGVQKIVSNAASIATAAFNQKWYGKYADITSVSVSMMPKFDCRVWNLPKEEVVNYFLWRQQDWTRNSVQMAGHHYFSHKQLHGKNISQIQDMLMAEHDVNWNDFKIWAKRGTAFYKDALGGYIMDEEMPILTTDRSFVERFVYE